LRNTAPVGWREGEGGGGTFRLLTPGAYASQPAENIGPTALIWSKGGVTGAYDSPRPKGTQFLQGRRKAWPPIRAFRFWPGPSLRAAPGSPAAKNHRQAPPASNSGTNHRHSGPLRRLWRCQTDWQAGSLPSWGTTAGGHGLAQKPFLDPMPNTVLFRFPPDLTFGARTLRSVLDPRKAFSGLLPGVGRGEPCKNARARFESTVRHLMAKTIGRPSEVQVGLKVKKGRCTSQVGRSEHQAE